MVLLHSVCFLVSHHHGVGEPSLDLFLHVLKLLAYCVEVVVLAATGIHNRLGLVCSAAPGADLSLAHLALAVVEVATSHGGQVGIDILFVNLLRYLLVFNEFVI